MLVFFPPLPINWTKHRSKDAPTSAPVLDLTITFVWSNLNYVRRLFWAI